jgi:hypothetical protein
MSTCLIPGPLPATLRKMHTLLLQAGLCVLLSAACLTPAQSRALASNDQDLQALLLSETELPTAAAACGIGIAGGRVQPADVDAQAGMALGIGKWVAGLAAKHVMGLLMRRMGRDEQYNRHLAVTMQLRAIEGQLQVLSERFDQLGDQIRMAEFRKLSGDLARDYVNPVMNGLQTLRALECQDAAVLNAQIMGRDPSPHVLNRDRALRSFERVCKRHPFDEIPNNLTAHFNSEESILNRYAEAVILPRRYLRHGDSVAFDDFFQRYHLVQIEALQLEAECELRFPPEGISPNDPHLAQSIVESVYQSPSSLFHRAQMDVLPAIMPNILPQDRVVLDWQTGLLWWNGVSFGAHPLVNEKNLLRVVTIGWTQDLQGPNGNWRFDLARLEEIEGLAALNAAMPLQRGGGAGSGRYPATLKPFLHEIGLNHVADHIPDSGNLSFVWAADPGDPIRRCHQAEPQARCPRYYDKHDRLGRIAATAPASQSALRSRSGHAWHAPQQCLPNRCSEQRFWNPGVVTLCKNPRHMATYNRCIADSVLGEWQGSGIYRARTLAADRFFKVDLAPLRRH